jgi:hypothetical protein
MAANLQNEFANEILLYAVLPVHINKAYSLLYFPQLKLQESISRFCEAKTGLAEFN